jgi:hypothetical protein
MIMASPQNTLKLTQTNPYTTQNQNLDGVFRGALCLNCCGKHLPALKSDAKNSFDDFIQSNNFCL